jgi:hypothetical protein
MSCGRYGARSTVASLTPRPRPPPPWASGVRYAATRIVDWARPSSVQAAEEEEGSIYFIRGVGLA